MWETILPFVAGATVAWGGAYLQHTLTARREDKLRKSEQKARRVQDDKDAVADLLAAMFGWHSAVVNLSQAYAAAARGATVDVDRIREYQEMGEGFGVVLARARLAVRNPAARPPLDALRIQHVKMSGHMSLGALGIPSDDFNKDFREFREVSGKAWQQLESACLQWDGSLPRKTIEKSNP